MRSLSPAAQSSGSPVELVSRAAHMPAIELTKQPVSWLQSPRLDVFEDAPSSKRVSTTAGSSWVFWRAVSLWYCPGTRSRWYWPASPATRPSKLS